MMKLKFILFLNLWLFQQCFARLKLPMKIYQVLAYNMSSDANFVISPSGLQSLMILSLMGSEDLTNDQISMILEIDTEDDAKEKLTNYKNFKLENIQRYKNETGRLPKRWMSAIFFDKSLAVTENFISILANFSVPVFKGDLSQSSNLEDEIKGWLAKSSHSLQRRLPLTNSTKILMLSSINYALNWKNKFDPKLTKEREWKLRNASSPSNKVPMMHMTNEFRLINSPRCGCQVLELPLFYPNYSFFIFLPNEGGENISKLEIRLSEDGLEDVIFENINSPPKKVSIAIPKFSLSWANGLKEALIRLGMEDLFDPKAAQLTGMIDGKEVAVGEIFQNIKFVANETGLPGPSNSSASNTSKIPAANKKIDFLVNRPFIFAIRDLKYNFTILLGRIIDPKQTQSPDLKKFPAGLPSMTNSANDEMFQDYSHLDSANLILQPSPFQNKTASEKLKSPAATSKPVVTSSKPVATTTIPKVSTPSTKPNQKSANKVDANSTNQTMWARLWCKETEPVAYNLHKRKTNCDKTDQKFLLDSCAHYLSQCKDANKTMEVVRRALITLSASNNTNIEGDKINSIQDWSWRATEALKDVRTRRRRRRRQTPSNQVRSCPDYDRYCSDRSQFFDKCRQAKTVLDSYIKHCGAPDVEKFANKEKTDTKGFFGKLWDDVKSAFKNFGK